MPQMSPMFWVVFPLVMMVLMVMGTMLMGFDSLVSSIDEGLNISEMSMKW